MTISLLSLVLPVRYTSGNFLLLRETTVRHPLLQPFNAVLYPRFVPLYSHLQKDFRVDSDVIATAIVIKNIPFAYPETNFVEKLFPELRLKPPYAFNYHRNTIDRKFHGLAFANFNEPHEAQAAVGTMNNYLLDGRRLRVELKKRLPADEEERRRLARQSSQKTPLLPMMMSDILDPHLRPQIVIRKPVTHPTAKDLDMNDPLTLQFYMAMQMFLNNPETATATLQFPPTLTASERRIVHALAVKLNLEHTSQGLGPDRFVTVLQVNQLYERLTPRRFVIQKIIGVNVIENDKRRDFLDNTNRAR